jgi:hypothetical protein
MGPHLAQMNIVGVGGEAETEAKVGCPYFCSVERSKSKRGIEAGSRFNLQPDHQA